MKNNRLYVEKIGGTSMSCFEEIVNNVILKDEKHIYNRIYVVSAYSGITNALLEHKKTMEQGVYRKFKENRDYQGALLTLKKRFFKINKGLSKIGLDHDMADKFISKRIQSTIDVLASMDMILSSGYVDRRELLLSAREVLSSIGEVHSAFNSANILKNKGYNTKFVDLSGFNDPRILTIDERIKDTFVSIDTSKTLCFVTGYTKGTEGIMREFDRGYSEVTFSKIAVFLRAREAVIHKEYHLSTGDPKLIGEENVRPICNTNFDVADQLADIRVEAIHPKASKPLENNGILIRIKNAFDPNHEGTLISKSYICPEIKIEMITGTNEVVYLEVHDPNMVGEPGFDLKIMQILSDHNVSFTSKMTNANTIGFVIFQEYFSKPLLRALETSFELVTHKEVAMVCVIGSNIAKPGILAQATTSLANASINIIAVSQTSRQTNIQFVILRKDFQFAQKQLHSTFCQI